MPNPISAPSSQYPTSPVPVAGLTYIDALADGLKWGGSVGSGVALTYSFPYVAIAQASWDNKDSGGYSALDEPAGSYGLNAAQRQAVTGALAAWSNVANIGFTQVVDGQTNVGDLRFTWTATSQGNSSAWAYGPSSYWASGGDVWLSAPAIGQKPDSHWQAGNAGFSALLHEIGHALGLKHPFEGNPRLSGQKDSEQYTVMSYTEHPHAIFRKVTANGDGSYTFLTYYVEPDTPMLYDIAAVQYLYGANTTYHTGNDTYTFDPATPFFRTLWDAGGSDTISVATFSKSCVINLNPGAYSSIAIASDPLPPGYTGGTTPTYDGTDNLAIAYGAIIENATGGSGDDRLIGNNANNLLRGNGGNDTLNGGMGSDTALYSGSPATCTYTVLASGSVRVSGPDGSDTLDGIERLRFDDGTDAPLMNFLPMVHLDAPAYQAKIEAYFLAMAGRAASAAELNQFATLLAARSGSVWEDAGGAYGTTGSLVGTLNASSEFAALLQGRNTDQIIDQMFQRLTGALPEQSVHDYYAVKLGAGTIKVKGLANAMLNDLAIMPRLDGSLSQPSNWPVNMFESLTPADYIGFATQLTSVGIHVTNLDVAGNLV